MDIPVIILAGGRGSRILEETQKIPKPMVKIGSKPILWHIMRIYSLQGFNRFIIATGYKRNIIEDWVLETTKQDEWGFSCNPVCFDTGLETQTGGRILKIFHKFADQRFLMTYGDGLANVNLNKLISTHNRLKKLATITSVRPPARFGNIVSSKEVVTHFGEKNQASAGWINGGFFVLEREVQRFINFDHQPFEYEPISGLVAERQLATYRHNGFWHPMDTLREKIQLEKYATENVPPWFILE